MSNLRELEKAATSGPWATDEGCYVSTPKDGVWFAVPYMGPEKMGVDAELIVALRNAAPDLLAFVDAWDAYDPAVLAFQRPERTALEKARAQLKEHGV